MRVNKNALVVLSGGQDSTTCLFWALQNFETVHAITFDYNQRHKMEVDSASFIAKLAGVQSHEVVWIPHCLKSTSPLTTENDLEQYTDAKQMADVIGGRIEKTFVPMRNMLFLTIAANRAIEIGDCCIVTGVCQEDNANYPDCTELFIQNLARVIDISLGTNDKNPLLSTLTEKLTVPIITPLMRLSKRESVLLACKLPNCYHALAYSHTSYDGQYPPTDMNHANVLRADGFEKAGIPDPLVLRAWFEGLMPLPTTENYTVARNLDESVTERIVDFVELLEAIDKVLS